MTLKKTANEADLRLERLYPEAKCSLDAGGDPWRLLVMARLSAQCTDERVNEVSKILFAEFPCAESMAAATLSRVEEIVYPLGLFRTKAKSIVEMSHLVCERFGGRVPDTMEGLLSLPGVGRKVANLVLGDVYGQGGIVADTHCIRICGRLGFYGEDEKNPLKTEKTMEALVAKARQSDFCHRIVLFGRDVCRARVPACGGCPLADICRHYKYSNKNRQGKE